MTLQGTFLPRCSSPNPGTCECCYRAKETLPQALSKESMLWVDQITLRNGEFSLVREKRTGGRAGKVPEKKKKEFLNVGSQVSSPMASTRKVSKKWGWPQWETARNQLQGTEVYQQPKRAYGGFFPEPPIRAKLANNETLVTHFLNFRTVRESIWVVLRSVCDNLLEQPSETPVSSWCLIQFNWQPFFP